MREKKTLKRLPTAYYGIPAAINVRNVSSNFSDVFHFVASAHTSTIDNAHDEQSFYYLVTRWWSEVYKFSFLLFVKPQLDSRFMCFRGEKFTVSGQLKYLELVTRLAYWQSFAFIFIAISLSKFRVLSVKSIIINIRRQIECWNLVDRWDSIRCSRCSRGSWIITLPISVILIQITNNCGSVIHVCTIEGN